MTPFQYQNGRLHCEAVPLEQIANQIGTPVYIYSQAELLSRAAAYIDAAQAAATNPLVCYALKANGNPHIIRLLAQAGLGADVTSGGELFLALAAGVAPNKIIFSGVGKRRDEIEMALRAGIRALHVESEMELGVIGAIAAEMEQVTAVGVRVNPNIKAETHPYISTGQHEHKFGVPLEQAVALLHQAAAHPWLNPVGLAAHIGSQIEDVEPFIEAAEFLAKTATQLAATGLNLAYVDVGGGLGIRYADDGVDSVERIRLWATAVAQPITTANFNLVLEPGRSLVAPAGALLTQVVYTKQQGQKQFLITDAGMNDLIRPTLYKAYHAIWPLNQKTGTAVVPVTYDVVGPICESGDFLAKERPLSPTQAGDYVAVMQAGAYGFAMSSNYNGRLRPAEVLVTGDQFHLIRQRQTYQHLLDGCNIPPA
ncbi:MAG: diaminopimelate decarboxylase [Ardenticatenaceae bacterium]|nr:diaminopimelate decarboxylase [Ardenticatenaceae bacterium]